MHCAPLLRITLRHPRWRQILLLGRKRGINNVVFVRKKGLNRSTIVSNVLKEKWSAHRSLNLVHPDKETDFSEAFSLPGRRVVELGVLAKSLDEGCKTCKTPLRLSDCTDETISGLGSYLYIVCQNPACGEINQCSTNKSHRVAGTTRWKTQGYLQHTCLITNLQFF